MELLQLRYFCTAARLENISHAAQFAVSAAFVFGDHLGFTAGFAPEVLPAMILGKLAGGISAVAVALLLCAQYLLEHPELVKKPLLLVFNSCEEGLGNLKGTRQIFKDYEGRIKQFISFDGTMSGIVERAVGSERWKVTATTKGGHSYGSFGNPNAIAALSGVICCLYGQPVPQIPGRKTTYNVGTIQGGTKANIIADEVVMTGTIRTLDAETLDIIQKQIKQIVENTAACFGGEAETEIRMGYPAVMCDYDTTMVLKELAEKALGPDSYTIKTEPGMGGEDFSYFANEVPSAYFRLGILGENGGRPQTLHNEFLCPDERCMKTGMLMEVLGTLALLEEEAAKV